MHMIILSVVIKGLKGYNYLLKVLPKEDLIIFLIIGPVSDEGEKMYDAYVAYSIKDENFVSQVK